MTIDIELGLGALILAIAAYLSPLRQVGIKRLRALHNRPDQAIDDPKDEPKIRQFIHWISIADAIFMIAGIFLLFRVLDEMFFKQNWDFLLSATIFFLALGILLLAALHVVEMFKSWQKWGVKGSGGGGEMSGSHDMNP